ncbi:MAG TPA: phosphate-starvation-inducible PsiE family protein [Gemmatimonadaceae bacterium]
MDVRLGTGADSTHGGDASRATTAGVPYTGVHHLLRRFLELALDVLVVLLSIGLSGVMVRALLTLARHVLGPTLEVRVVVSEALFALVLVELQRLLIIYLRDHHVSVDVMVEATIVASLREVLLLSAVEMEPLRLLALTAFVLVLGLLLRFGDLRAPRRRVRAHGAGRADHARAPRPRHSTAPPTR